MPSVGTKAASIIFDCKGNDDDGDSSWSEDDSLGDCDFAASQTLDHVKNSKNLWKPIEHSHKTSPKGEVSDRKYTAGFSWEDAGPMAQLQIQNAELADELELKRKQVRQRSSLH